MVNRDALRQTRGGPAVGTIATHFIPPGMPGFEEAGGNAGPGYDFYKNPKGDLTLAQSYMKKAGYPSGKYTGRRVLMVGDNQPPATKTGEAFQAAARRSSASSSTYRQVPHATMLLEVLPVPKAKVAICPNLGWGKDFFDSQTHDRPDLQREEHRPGRQRQHAQAQRSGASTRAMDKAEELTDARRRAPRRGAELDKELTGQALTTSPWLWDNQVNFTATNVNGRAEQVQLLRWDLTFSSLK